jgi:predicted TIM-barrel fold metal-dependent hydrolase
MNEDRQRIEERARKHAQDLSGFIQHLGAFLSVGLFFLILNLLTDRNNLWFYWPLLPWGIGLSIHGWNVFWADRFFDDRWEDRQVEKQLAREYLDVDPQVPAANADIAGLAAQAAGLIDRMRTSARQITGPDARRQALDACAAADQVLAAIIDHPDELPLARDFVNRFLEPATQVVTEYARLSSRNIPSARETLEQVEQHDLPLITHKANQLYDRLHRGTLIDLEVAREMLTLDMADTSVPGRPSEKEVRTP